jgi:hypothetical protein
MRFEQKTEFGLLGETLVADLIRFEDAKGFEGEIAVRINSGRGLENGRGIRRHWSDGTSEVIPDIEITKLPLGGRRQTILAEVKTKTAACAWRNGLISAPIVWPDAQWEPRTGIDIKSWGNYCWYYQKYYEHPLWLVFVHPLDLIQLRGQVGVIEPGVAGVYRAELGQLFDLAKHAAGQQFGNMIYWPISDLERWRSGKHASENRATRRVWSDLVHEAEKRSKRVKIIGV